MPLSAAFEKYPLPDPPPQGGREKKARRINAVLRSYMQQKKTKKTKKRA